MDSGAHVAASDRFSYLEQVGLYDRESDRLRGRNRYTNNAEEVKPGAGSAALSPARFRSHKHGDSAIRWNYQTKGLHAVKIQHEDGRTRSWLHPLSEINFTPRQAVLMEAGRPQVRRY